MSNAMHSRHPGRLQALIVTAAALAVAACQTGTGATPSSAATQAPAPSAAASPSGESTPRPVVDASLRLDFIVSWYHAPFYLALDRGYYEEAGLNLDIQDGQGSTTTGQVVATGSDTFGLMSMATMILAVDQEAELQAIGGYIQRNPESLISLEPTGIRTPKDLEGKTWGHTTGSSGESLFPIFAAENDVDESTIRIVNVDAAGKLQALLLGSVDFITNWRISQNPVIEAEGKVPANLDYADYGVGVLGHGLITNSRTVSEEPDLVRGFLEATVRGIEDAIEDPEAAVDALIAHREAVADRRAILISQLEGLESHLHSDNTAGEPLLVMSNDDWSATLDAAQDHLGASAEIELSSLYTNDFIAVP